MQVNGEVFSLRGNKHLLDQRGAEIFVIKRKLLSLRGHMEVRVADVRLACSHLLTELMIHRCILQDPTPRS